MPTLDSREPFIIGDQALLTLVISDFAYDPVAGKDVEQLFDLTDHTVTLLYWVADEDGRFVEYATTAEAETAAGVLGGFTELPQNVDATKGQTERALLGSEFVATGPGYYKFRPKVVSSEGAVNYGSSYLKSVVTL